MHSPIVSTVVQRRDFAGRCSRSVRGIIAEGCDSVAARCPLLIVMGCEMPGYDEAVKEIAPLEVKAIRGLASREEINRLRSMLDQWQAVTDLLDAIFGASYFCDPRVREMTEKLSRI